MAASVPCMTTERRDDMKTKLIALMLLAGGSLMAETHFSIGIGVGPGYYPPPVVAVRPPCPGPGYTWVGGYRGPRGAWIAGYWAAPVYGGSYWAQPNGYYRGDYGYRRDYDGDRWRRGDRGREWRGHDRGHGRDRRDGRGYRDRDRR